jgi:hypothetical protein
MLKAFYGQVLFAYTDNARFQNLKQKPLALTTGSVTVFPPQSNPNPSSFHNKKPLMFVLGAADLS